MRTAPGLSRGAAPGLWAWGPGPTPGLSRGAAPGLSRGPRPHAGSSGDANAHADAAAEVLLGPARVVDALRAQLGLDVEDAAERVAAADAQRDVRGHAARGCAADVVEAQTRERSDEGVADLEEGLRRNVEHVVVEVAGEDDRQPHARVDAQEPG